MNLEDDEYLDALAARVARARGRVMAVALPGELTPELVARLDIAYDHVRKGYVVDVDICVVLGAASTTAASAVPQFVAALRLPYGAARGWTDLLDHLGDRSVSQRQCVIVTDAARLLADEDRVKWRDLLYHLPSGPHCFGGGWTTLVLTDRDADWVESISQTLSAG